MYTQMQAFYALILFMAFAMAGTLATDWVVVLYLLGISVNTYLFYRFDLG
jgi:hypothetical protein